MTTDSKLYQDLAAELLGYWTAFASGDDAVEEKVGRALRDLLEIADGLRSESNWRRAQECCEMGLELVDEYWDPGCPMDSTFAQGVVDLYLGAICVGQGKLNTAADYYEVSAGYFRNSGIHLSESVPWLSLGKVHRARRHWIRSLWAYQRGLNVISSEQRNVRRHSTKVDQLQKWLDDELSAVKQELEAKLRGVQRAPRPSKPDQVLGQPETVVIPVVRRIAAGEPMWTGEAVTEDNLDSDDVVDRFWMDKEHALEAVFALQVQGDSMQGAGINNGDFVLIRPQREVNNGEIAVVTITQPGDEPEATLKKFYKEQDHVVLQPMNPNEKRRVVIPSPEHRKTVEGPYQDEETIIQVGEPAVVGKAVAVWRVIAR